MLKEKIYPISDLQRQPSKVKAAAKNDLVRITENGVGAYVFCSEEVFNTALQEAVDAAFYEEEMSRAIQRGRGDIADGRYLSREESFEKALTGIRSADAAANH